MFVTVTLGNLPGYLGSTQLTILILHLRHYAAQHVYSCVTYNGAKYYHKKPLFSVTFIRTLQPTWCNYCCDSFRCVTRQADIKHSVETLEVT